MAERLPDLSADAARLAAVALAEDGPVDLTTAVTVRGAPAGTAIIEARTAAVVSGLRYAEEAARLAGCDIGWRVTEGQAVEPGEIGRLTGDLTAILHAERTVLNLLQRACGIATATCRYVEAMSGTGCRVLHTRKTAPGLRLLDVAAVVAGGGTIHRIDLAHTVMVKDNHWRALERDGRSLAEALEEARARGAVACQVEVETEAQLVEACEAGADRLLIDNQTPATVRVWAAVARNRRPGIAIEATGGITLENVREYALAGADFISIGALTHSVRAADISLNLL
ncbi:MAG: carboxylating nicotinate-nucleotide diphosphorylase [Gemmatimonadales bacterium]|nr:carboxylating nicotinate-nucleotide diphosphorylase [Gemmatimonadales bacterium]